MLSRLGDGLRWIRRTSAVRWPLLAVAVAYVIVVPAIWDTESGWDGLLELSMFVLALYLAPDSIVRAAARSPALTAVLAVVGLALTLTWMIAFDGDDLLGRLLGIPGVSMVIVAVLVARARHE